MKSLRALLQDADPLRHEVPRLDDHHDALRQHVLHALPFESNRVTRARISIAATLAILLGVVGMGYALLVHGTTPLLAAVRFEVRLAEERPIPGLTVAQVGDSGRLLYLHPEIVVSNDDIAQSWVVQDGDRFSVAVSLFPSGAERIRQATTGHEGRPVAILIDSQVVSAPVVRDPIGDSAVISGAFSRAEADRIAQGIGR